jgi:hypothetical protein
VSCEPVGARAFLSAFRPPGSTVADKNVRAPVCEPIALESEPGETNPYLNNDKN